MECMSVFRVVSNEVVSVFRLLSIDVSVFRLVMNEVMSVLRLVSMEVVSLCRLGSIRAGFEVGLSVCFKGSQG